MLAQVVVMKNNFLYHSAEIEKDQAGFSLVEAMIAIFLLTIMMLGALRGMTTIYDIGRLNAIRDEGSKLSQEMLTDASNQLYTALVTQAPVQVARQVKNVDVNFTVTQTVIVQVASVAKSVNILVAWNYKGKNYSQTSSIIVGNK